MLADWQAAQPILAALQLPGKFRSRAAWLLAAGAVASRSMHVPFDDVGCLTPFGDMFNYAPPPAPTPPIVPSDGAPYQALLSHHAGAVQGVSILVTLLLPHTCDCHKKDANTHHQQSVQRAACCPNNAECTGPNEEEQACGVAGEGRLNEAAGRYELLAQQPYSPGDQVFLCYGRYTDLDLLAHYGFLLPVNAHDEVLLPGEVWQSAAAAICRDAVSGTRRQDIVLDNARLFFHPGARCVFLLHAV